MQPRPLELARTLRARSKRRPKVVLSFLLQVARSGRIFEGSRITRVRQEELKEETRGKEGELGWEIMDKIGQC